MAGNLAFDPPGGVQWSELKVDYILNSVQGTTSAVERRLYSESAGGNWCGIVIGLMTTACT